MASPKILFNKSMRDVPLVFNGMAIWTKNLQVIYIIIFSVSIFMMNSKNFFNFAKSASLTFYNKISCKHVFSSCGKAWIPNIYFCFIYTRFAAKHFSLRRTCKKFYAAMFAIFFNRSFDFLGNVIAFSAAIFCQIRSRRYVIKIIFANFANRLHRYSGCESLARSGAILKIFKPIYGNISIFPAITTFNLFSGARL